MLEDVLEEITSDEALVQHYSNDAGLSPEAVVLEKERRTVLVKLVRDCMRVLSRRDRKILWLYIKGESMRQIGEKLGISKQSTHERLNNIPRKLQKSLTADHLASIRAYLLDNPSTTEADTPKFHLGWPVTYLQKVSIEGRWGISRGKKVYHTQTECRIPEYIGSSVCGMCGIKCKRKENER